MEQESIAPRPAGDTGQPSPIPDTYQLGPYTFGRAVQGNGAWITGPGLGARIYYREAGKAFEMLAAFHGAYLAGMRDGAPPVRPKRPRLPGTGRRSS